MTDPYRTPPAGWKPELREGSSFLKREVPPGIFERMEALLNEHRRATLAYVPPLAFALGPEAKRAFWESFHASMRPDATRKPAGARGGFPTWSGVPVADLLGCADPNEVRLVR